MRFMVADLKDLRRVNGLTACHDDLFYAAEKYVEDRREEQAEERTPSMPENTATPMA